MPTIEKDWTTTAGLRAVVLVTHMGHRCGYVGVPPGHPQYFAFYQDDELSHIDVHGSLTYSDNSSEYPIKNSGLWWFGFDCAHYNDMTLWNSSGVHRSLEFCVAECESLALQITENLR